jgi:hypothetical protein
LQVSIRWSSEAAFAPVSTSTTNELVEVLRETREFLARPDNNFIWSHWDGAADALREFDALVAQIESGDTSRRSDLELLFAPTGSIQEVSISSGWGEEFLTLSARLDAVIKRV